MDLTTVKDELLETGSVLLPQTFDPNRLLLLRAQLAHLPWSQSRLHIHPTDLANLNIAPFHDQLFTPEHHELVTNILDSPNWRVNPATGTRQIGPNTQPPLGPHLDAYFHSLAFTINFWTPLEDNAGFSIPGLAVAKMTPQQARDLTGYRPKLFRKPHPWNFQLFAPRAKQWHEQPETFHNLAQAHHFKINTPHFRLGDAMLLTNWTLHWSHVPPTVDPTVSRMNVEMRFDANQSLERTLNQPTPWQDHAIRALRKLKSLI